MASLIDRIVLVSLVSLVGCDDLAGLGGTPPPLVRFQVAVTGDPASVAGGAELHALRIGLIWGDQWLTEPICILPPESPEVAAVLAAGCRDPFGFVPRRVTASAPLVSGAPTAVELFDLPDPDVMIGDVTARITYGSFVLFDDVDDSGTLELDRPRRPNNGDEMGPPDE